MRVLITSGGTKVPLDPVRDITNMSQGTFGSHLAKAFLQAGHAVHFLHAVNSKTPFKLNIESNKKGLGESIQEIVDLYEFKDKFFKSYGSSTYRTYEDYYTTLKYWLERVPYDIVILAAAVSDYLPEEVSNKKIKSSEELTIKLKHAPKVISQVREWSKHINETPICLVGFKLLLNCNEEELIDACKDSIEKNKCDLVVGNEWNKLIQQQIHELLLVGRQEPNQEPKLLQKLYSADGLCEYLLNYRENKNAK